MLAIHYCQYLANNKLSVFYYLLANIFFFFGLPMMYLLYSFVIRLNICVNFELYVNSFCIVLCFFFIVGGRCSYPSHSVVATITFWAASTQECRFPRHEVSFPTFQDDPSHSVVAIITLLLVLMSVNASTPDVLDVEVQRTAVMIYEDNVEVLWF